MWKAEPGKASAPSRRARTLRKSCTGFALGLSTVYTSICRKRGVGRLLEMKTKFVSAIFLLLLVWVTSPGRTCICPDEIKNVSAVVSAVMLHSAPGDLCPDCGHKRSCCSAHHELAIIPGGAVEIPEAVQLAPAQVPYSTFVFQLAPKKHRRLRAPPVLVQQFTPFSAKKVLLI
jgi:hypothetical protein